MKKLILIIFLSCISVPCYAANQEILKELLQDENYYTTNLPKKWIRVYHVRKAAKTALEQMKESVDNMDIEEPDK